MERFFKSDVVGYRLADQFIQGVDFEGFQHFLSIGLAGSDVPADKPVRVRELAHNVVDIRKNILKVLQKLREDSEC